jgi:hypothetical protein
MKVYALISCYYFCDYFESIVDLYQREFDAITERVKLEDNNTDDRQSYYVEEMEVL